MSRGRRPGSGGSADARALLFLAACALAVHGRGLLPGRVLSTGEILFNSHPWKALHPGRVAVDPRLNDLPLQFNPWLSFARAEVRAGRLPLWNPHAYCGAPFLGAGQPGVFSPFNAPAYLLPLPAAIGAAAVLKTAAAGLGTFWFLRLLGTGTLAAALGALAFMFGGFLTVWLMWPVASAAAWLPALLAAAEKLRRSGRARDAGLVAAFTALHLLAGHPETSLQVGLAGLAWALFRARGAGTGRFLALFAAGNAVGALLAGVQLAPFLDYLARTATFGHRALEAASSAVEWKALPLLLVPRWFGYPGRGTVWDTALGYNYNEISWTVGLVPLVLAPCALLAWRSRKETVFFAGAAAVLFAFVFREPALPPTELLPSLAAGIPGLSGLRLGRLLLSLGFCLAVLGALGLDALVRGGKRAALAATLASLSLVTILLIGLALAHPRMVKSGAAGAVTACALAAVAGLVTAGWISRIAARGVNWRGAAAALVALEFASLAPFAVSYIPLMKAADFFPETGATAWLRAQPGLFRVLSPAPNVGAVYGWEDPLGYDALNPRHITDLTSAPESLGPRRNAATEFTRGFSSPLLDLMNVRFLLLAPDSPRPAPHYELAYSGNDARVWRNTRALPRAWLAGSARAFREESGELAAILGGLVDLRGEVTLPAGSGAGTGTAGRAVVSRHAPGAVSIRTESPAAGWLFLADSWDPGWRAKVDGRPARVLRADHAFMAVEVGAGRHEVEFRYEPLSFRIGLGMSVLGLIGAVALFRIRS